MYIVPSFLEPDFIGIEWQSPIHREVAAAILLCNPMITQKDILVEYCKVVNAVPQDRIEKWTIAEAIGAGIPIHLIGER